MSSTVITARISAETLELVDSVARKHGRSRSWFISEAVERAAQAQAEYDEFVQKGIDSADQGMTVSQDEMERWWIMRKAARRVPVAAE